MEDVQKEVQKLKDEYNKSVYALRGQVLQKSKELKKKIQSECNHKRNHKIYVNSEGKLEVSISGHERADYGVIKHQFQNGDICIRCLSCGKWWKPGDVDYKEALNFPTANTMSSGFQFHFSDFGESYRNELKKSMES